MATLIVPPRYHAIWNGAILIRGEAGLPHASGNHTMTDIPQVIVGVPGAWRDRQEIVDSIADNSGGYLFAGMVLMDKVTQDGFTLEVHDHDPQLVDAIAHSASEPFSDDELQRVAGHTYTLYLVGEEGSVPLARKFIHAAQGLLKAGGIVVNVESAGLAFNARDWDALCAQGDHAALLSAYVMYVRDQGSYYSFGMHNLGYPDVCIEADMPQEDAALLLHALAMHLLDAGSQMPEGATFNPSPAGPTYRLVKETSLSLDAEELFRNPHGLLKMIR